VGSSKIFDKIDFFLKVAFPVCSVSFTNHGILSELTSEHKIFCLYTFDKMAITIEYGKIFMIL